MSRHPLVDVPPRDGDRLTHRCPVPVHGLHPDWHLAWRRAGIRGGHFLHRDRAVPQFRKRDKRAAGQGAAEGGLDALTPTDRAKAVAKDADVEIVTCLPGLALRPEAHFKQDFVQRTGCYLGEGLLTVRPL